MQQTREQKLLTGWLTMHQSDIPNYMGAITVTKEQLQDLAELYAEYTAVDNLMSKCLQALDAQLKALPSRNPGLSTETSSLVAELGAALKIHSDTIHEYTSAYNRAKATSVWKPDYDQDYIESKLKELLVKNMLINMMVLKLSLSPGESFIEILKDGLNKAMAENNIDIVF